LSAFGIGVKTIAPGNIRTDFAGRSLVLTSHNEYADLLKHVEEVFRSPKGQRNNSSAEEIAAVVYEACTDGKSKLRYIAGKDAKSLYRVRKLFGYKFFMGQTKKMFFK
jgi:NAD(P)-dependent dehydrogenase (short-subunit alcohol dehydrogenase family)